MRTDGLRSDAHAALILSNAFTGAIARILGPRPVNSGSIAARNIHKDRRQLALMRQHDRLPHGGGLEGSPETAGRARGGAPPRHANPPGAARGQPAESDRHTS